MSGYDPSQEPPGIGRKITLIVLGVIFAVALACAYSLHAFWWQ